MAAADAWLDYWEGLPEGQLLFRPEAEEFARNLKAVLPLSSATRVLDFGCGYGFVAEQLAPAVGELYLWDAAPSMRRHAVDLLTRHANVHLLDPDAPPALDLILVNSVVQYMTPEELRGWLERWRGWLTPAGRVILADLIPPGHSPWRDLFSLVCFSLRRGYFLRAMRNVRATHARYRQAEQARPLYRPGHEEIRRLAEETGYAVEFLPRNLTHFRGRRTALLTARERR